MYQYIVRNLNHSLNDVKPQIVTSTLDPVSYVSYHGGSQAVEVELMRSWPCPGYTGLGKAICPSPYRLIGLAEKISE